MATLPIFLYNSIFNSTRNLKRPNVIKFYNETTIIVVYVDGEKVEWIANPANPFCLYSLVLLLK